VCILVDGRQTASYKQTIDIEIPRSTCLCEKDFSLYFNLIYVPYLESKKKCELYRQENKTARPARYSSDKDSDTVININIQETK